MWQERMTTLMPTIIQEQLIDFYRIYVSPASRSLALELYRSGDLEKLAPYPMKLRQMDCPVTVISGEKDKYVPVSFAYTFQDSIRHHCRAFCRTLRLIKNIP